MIERTEMNETEKTKEEYPNELRNSLVLKLIFRGFFGITCVMLFIVALHAILFNSEANYIDVACLIFTGFFSIVFWTVPVDVIAEYW